MNSGGEKKETTFFDGQRKNKSSTTTHQVVKLPHIIRLGPSSKSR